MRKRSNASTNNLTALTAAVIDETCREARLLLRGLCVWSCWRHLVIGALLLQDELFRPLHDFAHPFDVLVAPQHGVAVREHLTVHEENIRLVLKLLVPALKLMGTKITSVNNSSRRNRELLVLLVLVSSGARARVGDGSGARCAAVAGGLASRRRWH